MEYLKGICEWFVQCFNAVPENLVTGIYTGMVILVFRLISNKIIEYNQRVRMWCEKIIRIWNSQPEIRETYQIIPSPEYVFPRRRRSNNRRRENDGNEVLVVLLFLGIIGTIWLKENHEKVQLIFYSSSIIYMGLSVFFVTLSAFKNKIQSSTLKFSLFSTIVSMYIIYSANILPMLILQIPNDFNLINLITKPNDYWPSFYVFMGLVIAVLEIIVIALMLIRTIAVKIDTIMKIKLIQRIIFSTKWLERVKVMITLLVILTIASYLLTSGIFIELVLKL